MTDALIDTKVRTDYNGNSVGLDSAIIELYDRINRLEQENLEMRRYIDHVKKILPWVPDENGEYKWFTQVILETSKEY